MTYERHVDPEVVRRLASDDGPPKPPPPEAEGVARVTDLADLAKLEPTDLGNAERLRARHADELRYDAVSQRWYVWDGRRWAHDRTGAVHRLAYATARAIYNEAACFDDGDRKVSRAKFARSSEARPRLDAMVALAARLEPIAITPDDLDVDPWLVTVDNGTVDLRTGELRAHDPADLITRLAPVTYDPAAPAPTWQAFLDRIFDGDRKLVAFVARLAGYSLTGSIREQKLAVLHGSGGNGKTTLVEALRHVAGDYAGSVDSNVVLASRRDTGTATPELARLRGARFVPIVETDEGRRLAESLVKALTGGEPITARHLYGNPFTFRPSFTLWLATNHRPVVTGTDLGIWRRLLLVPFTVTIGEDERHDDLPDRLVAEADGIFAWAVRGAIEWQEVGLAPPEIVTVATAAYRADEDVLGAWLDERCVVGAEVYAGAGDLHADYREWAEKRNERELSHVRFANRLADRGFAKRKTVGGMVYDGVGLRAGPGART